MPAGTSRVTWAVAPTTGIVPVVEVAAGTVVLVDSADGWCPLLHAADPRLSATMPTTTRYFRGEPWIGPVTW